MAIDLSFDLKHIWHPYTSMTNPLPCYPVVSADGVYLQLENGQRLIDGMSSWWAAQHGYNHPKLNAAIVNQIPKMSHVMFGGITHEPAVELCKKLVDLTPEPLECVFLADSGSVAVEVSLKMALQYWHAKGEKRQKFLTIAHSYHGDTFGAMSVCDPENSMHTMYKGFLPEHIFAPAPISQFDGVFHEQDFTTFYDIFKQHQQDIAAIILEPIVQGAGGMRIYHPEFLKRVRLLCDEHQILLILDEIATGFGRTGKFFACEHANISPDIMCLGKAITGGMMTLSASIATREVANVISQGAAGCFMHGPTFMGNPLACSVANANLEILATNQWQQQVLNIEAQLKAELSPLKYHDNVADIRILGAIGVIETKRPVNMAALQAFFVKCNVWIRPFNRLIYIMPPYIIQPEELSKLTQACADGLNHNEFFL